VLTKILRLSRSAQQPSIFAHFRTTISLAENDGPFVCLSKLILGSFAYIEDAFFEFYIHSLPMRSPADLQRQDNQTESSRHDCKGSQEANSITRRKLLHVLLWNVFIPAGMELVWRLFLDWLDFLSNRVERTLP
jgi:hypothetical protein